MRSLLVFLVACGGSPAQPADPVAVPAADPAPCAAVGANVVKFIDPPPTTQVSDLIAKHCTDDKWSVALRKCIVTGKSEKELDQCEQYFVGTQEADFTRDLGKIDPQKATQPQPANGSDVPPAANPMPK